MYDYDDFWGEPSEFEQQIEEFKDTLRNEVKDEIKKKIERLEAELKELNEFKKDKMKFERECAEKIRKAEREAEATMRKAKESEEKWKKARLHELLGDYLTVGWKVGYTYELREKCDKCDDDRYIHFISPQGRKCKEACNCSERYYMYFPKEATLSKMYVRKKGFSNTSKRVDYGNRYYQVKDDGDYDCYTSVCTVYDSEMDFEKMNKYEIVFLKEEDCQKYCDWLNEKEQEKKKTH